ncbi:MAG: hypothetical protein ACP5E5_07955 [Acidobacteriaceae bacterium]
MSAAPARDKKTLVVVSIFGSLLLVFVVYAYNSFFGGSPNPAATAAPTPAVPAEGPDNGAGSQSAPQREESRSYASAAPESNGRAGLGVAPGVAARMLAKTSSSLDPTLDESAMLRTESLIYTGTGRNIFSLISAPPPQLLIPKGLPGARPGAAAAAAAAAAAHARVGPPPPPPIPIKFFGTAIRVTGKNQAFLLDGGSVYLASAGDIVSRRYRVVSIGTTSIQVEDLLNKDIQTLPLQKK